MKRRLSVLLVAMLAIGGATLPVAAADASTTKGTLHIQLTTPAGDDVASKGFVVTASGMTKNVYKEATTNAKGIATLKVPAGKYTITVATYRTKYEYAVSTKDYIAIARGQVKTIGMKLAKGAVITGKVTKTNGKALKGAIVVATTNTGIRYASATTDAKGKYVLRGLPTGKYVILFNEHQWADPKNAVVDNYGSKFYKGDTLASAKRVTVYAQNRYTGSTKTTGISGRVGSGTKLTVNLKDPSKDKGTLLVDRVSAKGAYLTVGSIYGPVAKKSTQSKLRAAPGTYRLGIQYGKNKYYYTGEGMTLTKDPVKAVTVTFTKSAKTINFGPRP
jgi:hypothetical protein